MDLAPERALFLVTGSQGEPTSALARIAVDKHRDVVISEGDLVLHSARSIPGNDKSIGRMINHLLRRGASVVTADDAPIHVSGHPRRDELALLIHLLRPKFLLPIHGEYRQLAAHAAIGRSCGLPADRVLVAESGDLLGADRGRLPARRARSRRARSSSTGRLEQVDFAMLQRPPPDRGRRHRGRGRRGPPRERADLGIGGDRQPRVRLGRRRGGAPSRGARRRRRRRSPTPRARSARTRGS